MGRFGERLTRGGTQVEDIAESVEDLGETLTEIVGAEEKPKRRATPKRGGARRPARKTPSFRRQPTRRLPPSAGSPQSDADGKLPETIRERIRALGKRKRSGPLRELIVDICTLREWTTVGELAGRFGMNTSNLQRRHLRPLLESGRLRLRHPENPRHPKQGYRATER